ncbi:MAG TPA: carbohydrate kinase [Terriglobales bacterium]|nr:carbohydrate kinase [Terriglobales bacterium]HXY52232.1 carbohydrate kinase [Terriglobales bacterium]
MIKPALVIGLGEVLWDLLPSGKVLGGAPANFAYMTKVLGDQGVVASRIGNDDLGRDACSVMQKLGLNTSYVQRDDLHETGTASVSLDTSGQPNFTIKDFVSWDFLQWTAAWEELSARADVVCFGSLAQRSPTSAATIECFLRSAPEKALRICDVNLRQSFYNRDVLRTSFQHAHIVKLNERELLQVSALLKLGDGSQEMLAKQLLSAYELRLVCITRGARGSLLVTESHTVEHSGFRVKVADAIGAGDAFAACLAHHYLRGHSLEEISEAANRLASWVATQTGATPSISAGRLQNILSGVALH